jgi:hypothetical protein
MSTQHTPGPTIYTPWHPDGDVPAPWVVEDNDTRCVVLDACGGLVADCTNGFDGDDGWVMSAAVGPLANLIAAAPDLLAALQYAVDNPEFNSEEFDRMARTAIAKTTGGAV